MNLESPVFEYNDPIPSKYTCDGENINPPLIISDVPKVAQSLVLICDDQDAPMGNFVHWLLINIDPKTEEIQERVLPKGAVECQNDFGKTFYGGPCPPNGEHRYYFKMYALTKKLDLDRNSTKADVLNAMEGFVVSDASLLGVYKRD